MSGNMEQNPSAESVLDPAGQQFRQRLNQWFEEHGVLDNLRSHLRSVMIAALQQTEFRLKPHQKTTPKIQSANLLVAEYLLKQGCHYTLSILMSELPALANFASGAILFHCRPKIGDRKKSDEKYRFQEKEVVEILNSLGVSSQDENLKEIWECYERNREEESLLECLLRFVAQSERNPKRCIEEAGAQGDVGDAFGKSRENSHPPSHLPLSRMSVVELKRAVEEENERRMRELIVRERRIQDYLKNHEEEVLQRLQSAEKELNTRRETIDRELSERQLHLGRIAFQLKEKHNEIMELSKSFASVKSENDTLRSKLDTVLVELYELREEVEKKSEIIERLEAERMSMKCHVQEYLKWKSRGGEMVAVDVTSNLHDRVSRKGAEKSGNRASSSPQDSLASSDESIGEEVLLDRVKARVESLERENDRIGSKYTKYKKKYDNEIENAEPEESNQIVCDAPHEDCVAIVEAFVEPVKQVVDVGVDGKMENSELNQAVSIESPVVSPRKKFTTEEEKKVLIPTKRQQKNLEYYIQSRSLLEALDKSAGLIEEISFSSTSDLSLLSRMDDREEGSGISEKVQENVSMKEKDFPLRDLSDLECLTLLKEATRSARQVEGPVEGDEGG